MVELYKYCLSVIDGYTYGEFIEFIKELVILLINKNKKLSDEKVGNIGGGAKLNNNCSKALSSLLATEAIVASGSFLTFNSLSDSYVPDSDLLKVYENVESGLSEEFSKIKDINGKDMENIINTAFTCLKSLPNVIIPNVSAVDAGQNADNIM